MMNATRQRIKEMLVRQLDHGLTDIEMQELSQYMHDPVLAQFIHQYIGELFAADEGKESLSEKQQNMVLAQVFHDSTTIVRPLYSWYRIAIAVAVLFFVGLGLIYTWQQKYLDGNEIVLLSDTENDLLKLETAHAQSRKTVLPDGTVVLLNAGSELYYSEDYGNHNRTVRLIGEAFFDVVKDVDHPFVIEGLSYNIRVLGTRFNLRNYPQEKSVTTLISGSLEILDKKNNERQALLKPLQKFTVDTEFPKSSKLEDLPSMKGAKFADIAEVAWMNDKLVFKDELMTFILKELERLYAVKFDVRNKDILQHRFSATFDKDNIDTVLGSLQYVRAFKYRREGDVIVIY